MYEKKLSSKFPGCILILVDQSSSMTEPIAGSSASKQQACAKAVNSVLYQLVFACGAGDKIKDRLDVGMIGYGSRVNSAFQGALANKSLVSISEVANNPIRMERDPATGAEIPVWLEPVAANGTPMHEAFQLAHVWVSQWLQENPDSFPPIVINITDGEPNDESSTNVEAHNLLSLGSSDGSLLLFNAHLSKLNSPEIILPSPATPLPDKYAQFLFNISSELPKSMLALAEATQLPHQGATSRGFVYNANADVLVRLLTFGTTVGLR